MWRVCALRRAEPLSQASAMIACDGARRAGGSSGVEAGRSSESYTLTMQLIDMAKALVWLPFRALGCASHALRALAFTHESHASAAAAAHGLGACCRALTHLPSCVR